MESKCKDRLVPDVVEYFILVDSRELGKLVRKDTQLKTMHNTQWLLTSSLRVVHTGRNTPVCQIDS